ncbi:MAG: hypothetical protein EB034_03305 [Verrucomicrobia bacterium]|nr:hypothetical protein [Verrucomicrobiota bacterium]
MVISIMGMIAALTVAGIKSASYKRDRSAVEVQLAKLVTAIESYKSKTGTYPPDCPANAALNPDRNPLAYELGGVRISGTSFVAESDPTHTVTPPFAVFPGLGGFVNAAPAPPARLRYTHDLRVGSSKTADLVMIDYTGTGTLMMFLKVSADHPTLGTNVWRYRAYPATGHNPKSFDLWAEIKQSGGGTNIIGNWR